MSPKKITSKGGPSKREHSPQNLRKKMAEIQRLVEKGEEDEKEAAGKFNELKELMAREKPGLVPTAAITNQQQREKLLRMLASSPYFQGLQQELLATIFPIGSSIVEMAASIYDIKPPIMTKTQRDELAGIGNRIANLPYQMLVKELDLKQGYGAFNNAIKMLTGFIIDKKNLDIAINIGPSLLKKLSPIGAFIEKVENEISTASDLSSSVQAGLLKTMGVMKINYNQLNKGLEAVVGLGLGEAAKYLPLDVQKLQLQFLTTIFPAGGAIINIAYNLYNAKPTIMTDIQRDELAGIGNRIVNLPFAIITGEINLEEGYHKFNHEIKSLTNFVSDKKNLNIAINIGATLLESIHPIGGLITQSTRMLFESGLPEMAKNAMMDTLKDMATHYDKLEKSLGSAAQAKLDGVKPSRSG